MNILRRTLNKTYQISGGIAAVSLCFMMLLVLAQIIARQLNLHIPSSDDFIGFLVVWSSFLGLAYTMHQSQHIRVELIVSRLLPQHRLWLNVLVGIVATIMLVVFSYHVVSLVHESWEFGDQTEGEIPLPLWVMQLPMAVGCLLFTLSMLDYTVQQMGKICHQSVSIKE